jgi:integrase
MEEFFDFLKERIAGARKYTAAGRDYALYRTLYLAGLRAEESASMDRPDVHFGRGPFGELHVRFGKGALRGVVSGLLQWAVTSELIPASPMNTPRRRAGPAPLPFLFDVTQARQLLDAAGALLDNPRAAHRGQTYRTIFALCYGLGLRAGEACGDWEACGDCYSVGYPAARAGSWSPDRTTTGTPGLA